jgi:DNA-binding response OmpR family regulator
MGLTISEMRAERADILYLEDHDDTAEFVTLVLNRNNYNVVAANNYDDALRLARTRAFDLYLIDNRIIGGSGIDLCKKIRKNDPVTPILFYSAAAYESDKEEAFAAGADGYLLKPALTDQLLREVYRLISAARSNHGSIGQVKAGDAYVI